MKPKASPVLWSTISDYTGLSQADSDHEDFDVREEASNNHPLRTSGAWMKYFAVVGWLLFLVLAVVFVFQDDILKQKDCFIQTSAYSPIYQYLPHQFVGLKTNGTLDFPSIYRGPPNEEIDEEWDRITIFRPLELKVSEEEFLTFSSSVETAVRNAPEYGGGFFVQPEFSHQLHCVNLLRKASYFKYEHYQDITYDFTNRKEEMIETHIDHCVEILRQFVMCHADAGLTGAHWVEGMDGAWPDFNTNKVCRDFEGLLEWTLENQTPPGTPQVPSKPHGAKALAVPP